MLLNASRFFFLPNYYLLIYRNCLKINFKLLVASSISCSLPFKWFSITFEGFNHIFTRFESKVFIWFARLFESYWPRRLDTFIYFWIIFIRVYFFFSNWSIQIVSNNFKLIIIFISNNFRNELRAKPLIFRQVFIMYFCHSGFIIFVLVAIWKLNIKCFIVIYLLIYHELFTRLWINFPKLFLSQIFHLIIVNMIPELFPAFIRFIMRFRTNNPIKSQHNFMISRCLKQTILYIKLVNNDKGIN